MESKLLENLNNEQLTAVKHTDGALLIVAGAGTGKTTVITRRIAYLVDQGLATPEEILALTFTDKASGEMCERVDQLLPLGYYDLWISTFHSFCERVLKNHALDIGLSNDFKLLDSIQQWILVHDNFEKFNLNYYKPLGSPDRFIDALLKHFSRCKDEVITPTDYLKYAQDLSLSLDSAEGIGAAVKKRKTIKAESEESSEDDQKQLAAEESARIQEIANAYHVYQKLLLDNNFLDFGDLINCALELFKKRPAILKFYQNKFKFFMVDEFQDTNFAQYQLVKMLAGDKQNLTVVGDDDQSIYKFRGASVSNILKFKEDFKNCQQITLVNNYRSTQNILDLAYNFIQANNPERLEVKLKIQKKLISSTTDEGSIEVLESEDLSGELHSVVKKILELKTAELSWNDFAILVRANSAADELLPVLTASGIPFTFVANKGLFKKPIIVDVLAYMDLLDNLHNSKALYRVLTLPKFKLQPEELALLLQLAKQKTLSLFEALAPAQTLAGISSASKSSLRLLAELIQKHATQARTSTAAEMMVQIIADVGLEQKLKADTEGNAESRELLDQFYKKIQEFEKENSFNSLHDFLRHLSLEVQAGSEGVIKFDPNIGPETIKVLTIHSAKGLEFNYVFIINMVEQRFPTREKSDAIEIPKKLVKDILPEGDFHLQEERRLFYVALTRARRGLYLTWSKDYGGARAKKPSQFLLETKLVPGDKVNKATGKVIFSAPKRDDSLLKVYTNLPTKFSYTDISTFQNCPLQYKFQCFLKLPVPGSFHQSFGSTIHKTFEDFLKLYKNNQQLNQTDLFGNNPSQNPLPEFKILANLYEKNWIDDWYQTKKQKEEYRELGKEMIKKFFANLELTKPKPKFIEQFFKLKLGNYDFVGKIDRADELPNGLRILDYKTGKTPKTRRDLDQLYIYQWAAEEFLKQKAACLEYWYMQGEGNGHFVKEEIADAEKITELKKELLDVIERIVYVTEHNLFAQEHTKAKDHTCEFEKLEL